MATENVINIKEEIDDFTTKTYFDNDFDNNANDIMINNFPINPGSIKTELFEDNALNQSITFDSEIDSIFFQPENFLNKHTNQEECFSTSDDVKNFNDSDIVLRMSSDSEDEENAIFRNYKSDQNLYKSAEKELMSSNLLCSQLRTTINLGKKIDDIENISIKRYETRSRSSLENSRKSKKNSVIIENVLSRPDEHADKTQIIKLKTFAKIIPNGYPEKRNKYKDLIIKVCQTCTEMPFKNSRNISRCNKCRKCLKYTCLLCSDQYTKTYNGIYLHIRKSHLSDSDAVFSEGSEIKKYFILNCNKCNEDFSLVSGLNFKCLKCEEKMNFRCTVCDNHYHTVTEMFIHIKHDHSLLKNSLAENQTKFKPTLKRIILKPEIKLAEKDNYSKCLFCDKQFNNTTSMKKHIRYCKSKPILNEFCSNQSKIRSYAKKHVEVVHGSNNNLKKKTDLDSVPKHQISIETENKHERENSYQCEYCAFEADNEWKLNLHIMQTHLKQLNKTIAKIAHFSSLIKNTNLLSSGSQESNSKTEKSIKNDSYKKNKIKKGVKDQKNFKNKNVNINKSLGNLLSSTHQSEFKYKKKSTKILRNKSDIAKLMTAHCLKCNESRPVVLYKPKCETCNSQLVFNCIKCHLEFKNREDLRMHIYTEHFKTLYECFGCGKNFSGKNNLTRHFKVCSQNKT